MSTTSREIIKGAAGGLGFLFALGRLGMPFWLAALIGAGLYAGLHFMMPGAEAAPAPAPALGLTAAERDQFLAACRRSNATLGQLASRIPNREFSGEVRELAQVAGGLIDYFEKKPAGILVALSVPGNLERLAAMLQQYVAICQVPSAGPTAAEALRRVEEIVKAANGSFAGMYEQLLEDDVAALDTSARTLAILLEVEARTGVEPSPALSESPQRNRRPAAAVRPTKKGNQT